MKVSNETYNNIKNDMLAIINGKSSIETIARACLVNGNYQSICWSIWRNVYDDRLHTDNHPSFKQGRKRVLPYIEGFEIYPDGTNDTTLNTALVKALKEIIADETARLKRENINM